jgi:hypothetical protein
MSEKDIEAIELLKQDFELGIYSQNEYEAELIKLGVDLNTHNSPDYLLVKEDHLKVYRHIEIIKSNMKPIAKMILENKWGQKEVTDDKIVVVCGQQDETFNLFSITFINKYGQFIAVELKDVVSYLDKIDFDE